MARPRDAHAAARVGTRRASPNEMYRKHQVGLNVPDDPHSVNFSELSFNLRSSVK